MQLYPAIRGTMGRWDYFMVRMSMRELAKNVKFADEIHARTHLSEAIQRELRRARATKEIASYLVKQEDRFFSSIVVAVLGGDPHWHPVTMEGDQFNILAADSKLADSFGVLTFNDEENYYALDGQHRLAAIRALLDGETEYTPPEGFRSEEISVILVTPRQLEDSREFMIRYRRLFGHLNRYAKPMSQFDNIVMDEDDALAIITRRLVTDHPFFNSSGNQFESSRIKMSKGKNITGGSSHWTSLEMLYELNSSLLHTRERRNNGWGSRHEPLREYKRFRPDEDEIDDLADELFRRWDAILDVLPVLKNEPSSMRVHNREPDSSAQDSFLFWPIGQEILVGLVQELLDDATARSVPEPQATNEFTAGAALAPLGRLVWDAHEPPWRHVLLIPSVEGMVSEDGLESEDITAWRIANEDRKPRMRCVERILRWQLGLDSLSEEELTGPAGLRAVWYAMLGVSGAAESDYMWQQIEFGTIS